MATTSTESKVPGDVIVSELENQMSRQTLLVAASQTLAVGTVCRRGASGHMSLLGTAADCVQTIGITGTLTAGSFNLKFVTKTGAEVITDPIAYNANTAAIQTGVDTALGASMVTVAGTAITAMTFTFDGVGYTGISQPLIEVDVSGLTGEEDTTVTMTTEGGYGAGAATNEVQTLTLGTAATAGTFAIHFRDYKGAEVNTAAIAYNANAATINTAIALVMGGAGEVVVTGTLATALDLTYSGPLYAGRAQEMATLDLALTTGPLGLDDYTQVLTTRGGPAGEEEAWAISLAALTSVASIVQHPFLVKNAVVRRHQIDAGSGILEDCIAQLRVHGIMVETEVDVVNYIG
jgi:hypothetical protein